VAAARSAADRFPPPWIAEETDAYFIFRDANSQALGYVYFEEEPGRRAAAKLLTRDVTCAASVLVHLHHAAVAFHHRAAAARGNARCCRPNRRDRVLRMRRYAG
jgi:hypothetical protein